MAILKTLLDEEFLTKQERSVLRSIYRAVALLEGVNALDKIADSHSATASKATDTMAADILVQKQYLKMRIAKALADIRIPNAHPLTKESKSKDDS